MICLSLALLALYATPSESAPVPHSSTAQEEIQEPAPETKKPKHLEKWPTLKDLPRAKRDLARLRAARTEEMAAQAHASLVELGPGVAALILPVLGKERKPGAQQRMIAVLNLVTDGTHTRLIAPAFKDRKPVARLWSLRRTALFPDKALQAAAEKALAAARKLKRGTDEEKEAELAAAALASAAAGSLEGFDLLGPMAFSDWGAEGLSLRAALEGVRGPAASELCGKQLAGDRKSIVQALRMLAGCGDKSILSSVAPHLASTDNSIRVEAINACRGIVDGDLPLPRLSAFQAIEMAKEWEARL